MNKKLKKLEFVQGIITRMGNNSFKLKGWSITVVLAILTLMVQSDTVQWCWIALIPVMMFWALDSYYLQQERLFRKLYEKDAMTPETDVSLKIDISQELFQTKETRYIACFFSQTEFLYYGFLFVIATFVCIAT